MTSACVNRLWRMAWERDLPAGVPVKVTLFDEDYVVVRGRERDPKRHVGGRLPSDEEPVAMLDKCPHRLAALSEGRAVFTGTGEAATIRVQCAYHGWTFDGVGRCRLIGSKPELKARLLSAIETKM
jgi:phenylpropionate dioxygenase-like ring-hydroxylating dioxygenase large terminal subunit